MVAAVTVPPPRPRVPPLPPPRAPQLDAMSDDDKEVVRARARESMSIYECVQNIYTSRERETGDRAGDLVKIERKRAQWWCDQFYFSLL